MVHTRSPYMAWPLFKQAAVEKDLACGRRVVKNTLANTEELGSDPVAPFA